MPIIIVLQRVTADHVFGKESIPLERNRPTIKGRPLLSALNIICFSEEINPYWKKSPYLKKMKNPAAKAKPPWNETH
jgi:hypothetical protein